MNDKVDGVRCIMCRWCKKDSDKKLYCDNGPAFGRIVTPDFGCVLFEKKKNTDADKIRAIKEMLKEAEKGGYTTPGDDFAPGFRLVGILYSILDGSSQLLRGDHE